MPILQNNSRVGRFVVQSLIKQNAYTETYRAIDDNNTPYFLKLFVVSRLPQKLVNPETGVVREVEYSQLLVHRNVVSFIDSGTLQHEEGLCQYYVTNYFSGSVLYDFVQQRGPLSEAQAMPIFRGILDGLNFMHGLSPVLCHNDIDPTNIMLSEAAMGEPQIIDLGHVSERCSGRVDFDTADLDVRYHATENMVGIFDEQSDVFSACAVLYFMLTGEPPWQYEVDNSQPYKERFMEYSRFRKRTPLNIDCLKVTDRTRAILNVGLSLVSSSRIDSIAKIISFLEASDESFNEQSAREEHHGREVGDKMQDVEPSDGILDVRRGGGNGFKDIAGMQSLKDFLEQKVIFVMRNPDIAKEYRLTTPNGMLLYGPPGCGKTYFAEKFAEESKFNFALIKSSDVASRYIHGSQEKISQLFREAEAHSPIVLCFDEFDALVPDRSNPGATYVSSEVNEFLSQMNNCAKRGIFIVATSNRPDKIDPAVLRTGRIDRLVYVPLPDAEARCEMFKLYLNNRPLGDDIDFNSLARKTDGYIASDIAYIVNDTAMTAAYSRSKITNAMLETTIKNIAPSLRPEVIQIYEEIRDRMECSNRANATKSNPIGFAKYINKEE